MKNIYKIGMLSLAIGFAGCEAVDPFETVNPNIGEEDVVGKPNSSLSWLQGLERQMAITFNQVGTLAEIGSDNYENTQTFYNQYLDNLDIQYKDNDVNIVHRGIGRLRVKALFGIEEIAPNDPNGTTAATMADYYFFLGISYIYAGEYFKALPAEDKGPLVPSAVNFQNAIDAFNAALGHNASHVGAMLGKARAYYHLGDQVNAVLEANNAIAADPAYLRLIQFDPVNSSGNNNGFDYTSNFLQEALFNRGSFDDLQPLPSLDFLDPKVYSVSGTVDSPIPLLKIEEAYLIIAESQIADNNLPGAEATLLDLINNVIPARPTNTFNDAVEGRDQDNPGSRPDHAAVVVDGRSGLVLDRQAGDITVPAVSGTSLTAAELTAALVDADMMLELLYRTRQEVFIAEGRRFTDMGLTFVISEQEALLNENIGDGHASTVKDVPAFIDADRKSVV